MRVETDEAAVLTRIVDWASGHDLVRVVVLTSNRANPRGPRDLLSDYDVELIVSNTRLFAWSNKWTEGYGTPLLTVRDTERELGLRKYNCMVLYGDGTKIDYTVWPLTLFQRIRDKGILPDTLDLGYKVLIDKDNLTRDLPPPTFTAHIPARPTEREYQSLVQEFWFVATYVAKYLWRDEFLTVKVIFDHELKWLIVRRMLEWRMEIDRDWSVKPGFFGRGLKQYIDPATWVELEATYVGPEPEDNWRALFQTIELFRRVAVEVGDALGYGYPHVLDARMVGYLQQIRDLESIGAHGTNGDRR